MFLTKKNISLCFRENFYIRVTDLVEYLNDKNVIEPDEFKQIRNPNFIETILDYGYLLSQEELEHLSTFMIVPFKYIESNGLVITKKIINTIIDNYCYSFNLEHLYDLTPELFDMDLFRKCVKTLIRSIMTWIIKYLEKYIKPDLEIIDLIYGFILRRGYSDDMLPYLYNAPSSLLFCDELLRKYKIFITDNTLTIPRKIQITSETRNYYTNLSIYGHSIELELTNNV